MAPLQHPEIIGQSEAIGRLFAIVEKIAADDCTTVLINGESGTGKELIARAIHCQSTRQKKNFVPLNCAAIPDELLESELFGHVKGAFTGAINSKMGRLEYAQEGTLFLDEIGDMKPSLQAKLLRVLQEKSFEPVGGLKPIPVNVRVVAATHRDLEALVKDGSFREDLFYRLSVLPITIPPLRERRSDIPLLLERFIDRFNADRPLKLKGFTSQSVDMLTANDWPGNVRELENLVQHMSVLCAGKKVDVCDLPPRYRNSVMSETAVSHQETAALRGPAVVQFTGHVASVWNDAGVDFNALVTGFETDLIAKALENAGGNKKEAARLLGLKRTTLLEKMRKKNIS